jgi:hypothetical protein
LASSSSMDDHAGAPHVDASLDSQRDNGPGMKLTLELDNGEKNTIRLEGELDDRLQSLKGMCVLLDMWATMRDKNNDDQGP